MHNFKCRQKSLVSSEVSSDEKQDKANADSQGARPDYTTNLNNTSVLLVVIWT